MCFQNLHVISFGEFALKYYHIISLVFILFIRKLYINKKLFLVFLYIILISLFGYSIFGFSHFIFNYIFEFYMIVLMSSLCVDIGYDEIISLLQRAAIIILIAIYIKLFINIDSIISFQKYSYRGHPTIPTFFGGGVNLEASWMSIFSLFFLYDRKKTNITAYLYCFLVFVIDCIYASRAGIITIFLCILFNSFSQYSKFKLRYILYIMIMVFALYVVCINTNYANIVLQRFMDTGKEGGSIGRINMWMYVWDAFKYWPIGSGAGNAIVVIEKINNLVYREDNVHNYFFQVLLDFGFAGFIGYLTILYSFFKKNLRALKNNCFVTFILVFVIISCLQFGGADSLAAFIVGIICMKPNMQSEKLYKQSSLVDLKQ